MKKLDDIIKKSLLNMKYDTKKTLFENKILLSEEETRSEMSYDGSVFDLSVNATNVVYIKSCDNYNYEESPQRKMFCEWAIKKNIPDLPYKTYDECYEVTTEYLKNKVCKVGGVFQFNFGGYEFTPCVRYHDGKNPYKLPELVKFVGYFDTKQSGVKGACGSLEYFPEMFEKQDEKLKKEKEVNQTIGPNVKSNVIDNKKQSGGESSNSPSSLNVINVIDDL